MKGYPKYVATKQDFINILNSKEYREQALIDLQQIADIDDDRVLQTISISEETGEAIIKEIENPMPIWKIKGFKSRQEIVDLIKEEQNG